MLDHIWAQIACKMASLFTKKLFKVHKMLLLSSSHHVERGMSRMWHHQKSYSFLVVHTQNSNWSFSESFSTYKVVGNTDCFSFRWNMTVKYRKLWWARSIAICNMIRCDKHVDLYLPQWGQESEGKGEDHCQQTWRTRSENIHFTLKIMCIIGQNKWLWDYLTCRKVHLIVGKPSKFSIVHVPLIVAGLTEFYGKSQ